MVDSTVTSGVASIMLSVLFSCASLPQPVKESDKVIAIKPDNNLLIIVSYIPP